MQALTPDTRKKSILTGGWFWLAAAAAFAGALYMFLWEYRLNAEMDLQIHASIAASFDFRDLHTITSRLAYPVWHLVVSVLYQLGMPLDWAAALVCALFRLCTFLLAGLVMDKVSGRKLPCRAVALCALAVSMITGLYVPGCETAGLYRFAGGSPNVWHNPTQQAVIATMLLCIPFLVHCWDSFEQRVDAEGEHTMLPWWKVLLLAVLLVFNLACKPTVLQAFMPAAFVMYAVELCRRPRNWRYFGQIVLAFIPATAYFLLQYLYYTGVVVPYTSGVAFGATWESLFKALRGMLLMNAFPLLAVVCCYRKGMFKNRFIVLALLMVFISMLEVAFFRETGAREGHGNFGWAAGSSAFFLWVVMLGQYAAALKQEWRQGTVLRKGLLGLCGAALLWHVASGVQYICFLLTTGNAF